MSDLQKLQGSWDVVSVELDGDAMPAPGGACIVIEGDRFQSLGMGAEYEGTVELNARKKPKHFDLCFTKGPEAGNRSLGIYELNGEEWKICLSVGAAVRPKSFATTPGSGHALETLRRGGTRNVDPAAPEEAVPETPGIAVPEIEGEWDMVACVTEGSSIPQSIVKTGRRVARDGITTSYFGNSSILHARYTVDRTAIPHGIDYTLNNGKRQAGIWKLEDGVLHVCFAPAGKPRPGGFETSKGQGHIYTAWKRK